MQSHHKRRLGQVVTLPERKWQSLAKCARVTDAKWITKMVIPETIAGKTCALLAVGPTERKAENGSISNDS